MTTLRVVKHLHVIEYITTSILSCGVNFPLDPFPFQQLEEALSYGIVVAVFLDGSCWRPSCWPLKTAPVRAAVLAALIRVNHHLLLRFAPPNRQ
jgi:hypothetical protein